MNGDVWMWKLFKWIVVFSRISFAWRISEFVGSLGEVYAHYDPK